MKKRVRIYKPTNKFAEGGTASAQYTPDQLVSLYMTALSEPGSSAEQAEDTLRQIGVDENTISLISDNAQEYVNDEQYFNDALGTADEDALTDITADQAAIDASTQEEQNALEAAEEEARSAAMQEMYANYNEPDYGDDTEAASQLIQRYGGMPSKRTFVKNVLKQVKKQAGGPSKSASVDSTDPNNVRKGGLGAFTNAVKVDGDIHLAKQDAEEMYKMMTTPIGAEESYYEEPDMDYAQFGGMRRGQMRRMNRRMNRMIGKLPVGFSGMPGGSMLPGVYDYTDLIGAFGQQQMPADGSYYRGPQMANIDVRRTGLFGRPKEYTITFADDVVNNPQTAENKVKQEVINKEEEIKDEVKAAEEGTVDQGVEEKKAEEAAQAAEEAAVDINDIQVVSGSGSGRSGAAAARGTSAEDYVSASEEAPAGKTPVQKGLWKGFDPSSVRFAGDDKSRAYLQNSIGLWFVSPNYNSKDKKNIEWYRVSDPNRIKNIERYTKKASPLVPGTTYTTSDKMPAAPRTNQTVYGDRSQSLADYIGSGQVLKDMGQDIKQGVQAYRKPTNMNNYVPKTAPRQTIGLGEKFQGGGFTDQSSGLYQFVYGGDDNYALQSPEGKLENDSPYFDQGGLIKAQAGYWQNGEWKEGVSARDAAELKLNYTKPVRDNLTSRPGESSYYDPYGYMRTKQKGLPYLTGSNQAYTGALDGAKVKSIDVKKTKAFGPYKGMPKKYTVNYQVERDPLSKRMSFDESGMKIDGQSMSNIAPTKQGIFNRGERQQMFGNRPDTAFESKSRALSWLGSKLRPFTTEPTSTSGMPHDKWDENYKKIYGYYPDESPYATTPDSTFAFNQSTPAADVEYPAVPDMSSMANYPLATKKATPLATQSQEQEIIPTQYNAPTSMYNTPEVADLEPGISGPMGRDQARDVEYEKEQQLLDEQNARGYGLNLLSMPTAQDEYMSQAADQNAYETQQAELQRMMEQNPDFYSQGVYNNPVFNPEEMTTGNIMDFNAPVVTPEEAFEVTQKIAANKATVPKRGQVPVRQNAPSKQTTVRQQNAPVVKSDTTKTTQPVVANQPEKVIPKKDTTVTKKKETPRVYIKPEGSTNYGGADKVQAAKDEARRSAEATQAKREQFKKSYGVDKATLDLFRSLKSMPGTEAQQRAMIQAHPALKRYYKSAYGGYMAYGGTLPQAVIGEDTPINQDERFRPRNTSFDLGSTNLENPFAYSGQNAFTGENSGVRMGTEGEYVNEGVIPEDQLTDFSQRKEYDDVSADFKNKGSWGAGAENRRLWMSNIINPAINFGLNIFDKPGQDMSWRNESTTSAYDQGDYRTNQGDVANMGQRQWSKYGGSFQNGGMYNSSRVGEYMWMTPEMIQQFLEEGGELEFI